MGPLYYNKGSEKWLYNGSFSSLLAGGRVGSGMGGGGSGSLVRLRDRCLAACLVRYWSLSSSSLRKDRGLLIMELGGACRVQFENMEIFIFWAH